MAQLIDADGAAAELSLLVFDRAGGPSRPVLRAPQTVASDVAQSLQAIRLLCQQKQHLSEFCVSFFDVWPQQHKVTEVLRRRNQIASLG